MLQVNIQGICDHEKWFTAYDMGWPGSMTDVFIWQNSFVWRQRATHFWQGEWLLADRGIEAGAFQNTMVAEPAIRLPIVSILTPPIQ